MIATSLPPLAARRRAKVKVFVLPLIVQLPTRSEPVSTGAAYENICPRPTLLSGLQTTTSAVDAIVVPVAVASGPKANQELAEADERDAVIVTAVPSFTTDDIVMEGPSRIELAAVGADVDGTNVGAFVGAFVGCVDVG